jgi:orotate phosphoribosyltransferase
MPAVYRRSPKPLPELVTGPVRPVSMQPMTASFDRAQARARLLELVREHAFRDGVDVTLVSGKRSDFYIQGKKITLQPEGLHLLARLLLAELDAYPEVTAIGGLTMGADPIAAACCALSYGTERPLSAFLVRKEAKGHGIGSRIEGELQPGQKVAIVEDTITTGGSARKAIDAVREVGAVPVVVLALADREDEDAAPFRAEFEVRPLFTVTEIRR